MLFYAEWKCEASLPAFHYTTKRHLERNLERKTSFTTINKYSIQAKSFTDTDNVKANIFNSGILKIKDKLIHVPYLIFFSYAYRNCIYSISWNYLFYYLFYLQRNIPLNVRLIDFLFNYCFLVAKSSIRFTT